MADLPQTVDVASSRTSMHIGHLYAVNTVLPSSSSVLVGFCAALTASSRCFERALAKLVGSVTSVRSNSSISISIGVDAA